MYIAVCDDNLRELEILTKLFAQWQEQHNTMLRFRTFQSASEMLDAARKEPFTMYILDVMMPGTNGLEAAREIRSFDKAADIVFLTSSSGFAYESYGVHALEYLLKPVTAEVLFPVLDNLFIQEQKPQEGITLKCGAALVRILFSQLAYVEVIGRHLYFNLTDGTVREVAGALKDYESILLSQPEFMKIHRSYIVNMYQAEELTRTSVRTFSGKILPVSRLLYTDLKDDYMKLLFTEREE